MAVYKAKTWILVGEVLSRIWILGQVAGKQLYPQMHFRANRRQSTVSIFRQLTAMANTEDDALHTLKGKLCQAIIEQRYKNLQIQFTENEYKVKINLENDKNKICLFRFLTDIIRSIGEDVSLIYEMKSKIKKNYSGIINVYIPYYL